MVQIGNVDFSIIKLICLFTTRVLEINIITTANCKTSKNFKTGFPEELFFSERRLMVDAFLNKKKFDPKNNSK